MRSFLSAWKAARTATIFSQMSSASRITPGIALSSSQSSSRPRMAVLSPQRRFSIWLSSSLWAVSESRSSSLSGFSVFVSLSVMFDKILHANDGSKSATRALSLALAIATQNQSELYTVCVEEVPYMPEFIEEVRDSTGRTARRIEGVLKRAQEMADGQQLKIHTHVTKGHPVRHIVALAADLGVDLLVIGAVGHSALFERMVGSKADRIMQLAHCPVLVVK